MIEFTFNVLGEPTTPDTAASPQVAQNLRAMEVDLRKKLQGAVPEGELLQVQIFWNRGDQVDFKLSGGRAAVDAAGKRLGLRR